MTSTLASLRPFGFEEGNRWLLLHSPNFADLAHMFAQKSPELVELGKISWSQFPDGTPNIVLPAAAIENRDVLFFGSAQEPLLEFFGAVYAIPRYHARTFTVVMPFYPTGTMERVSIEGEVATAKTLARMMDATPRATVGQTQYIIYDIHALATRFFFSDNISVHFVSATPMLLRKMADIEERERQKPMLAFPDEGAKKRFATSFPGFDVVLCIKTRVGNERHLALQEGNPEGRHCVIVDDLVQSGGTLISCKDFLFARGARAVSAYVTHGVFPNQSWEKFFVENTKPPQKPFEKFFITDSVPLSAKAVQGKEPFYVFCLGESLTQLLMPKPKFA